VVDERFGPAETHCQREYLEFFEDGARFGGRGLEFDRHDAAEAVHLSSGEVVLGCEVSPG